MTSFAHIVNPVDCPETSDLFVAQPITFESMRRAHAYAESRGIGVGLFTAQFPEDRTLPGFTRTPDLERSIYDFGTFTLRRKLPLVSDVFERLYRASDAEIFVYTNVDIALRREFYVSVSELMQRLDAAVINRRTVRATPEEAKDLDWLSAQPGEKHMGWDCFVFRREVLLGFDFHRLVLGALPIGLVLLAIVSTRARRFELFEDLALTFHINDDKSWVNPALEPFHAFNFGEAWAIVRDLEPSGLSPHALRLKNRILRERPELTR